MVSYDHNENMYISSGKMIDIGGKIYEDFAFLQMPYLPLIYGFFYRLTGTSHYLLLGKFASFLLLILSAVILYLNSLKQTNNFLFPLLLTILLLLNQILLRAASETSNYILPIVFSLISYYLFVRSMASTQATIRVIGFASSGFALSLAVGARLTYAVLWLPFILVSLYYPRHVKIKEKFTRSILPFTAGFIFGFLPLLYFLIKDHNTFIFNNLGYHHLNTTWYALSGYERSISFSSKLIYTKSILLQPDYYMLIIALIFLFLLTQVKRGKPNNTISTTPVDAALAGLLLIVSLGAAFAPTPLWPQYFAMPIPFLLLLLSSLFPRITLSGQKYAYAATFIIVAFFSFYYGPIIFESVKSIHLTGNWSGIAIHKTSNEIRKHIGTIHYGGKIATLSPLYIIESDLPIYNELVTGVFLYRVGDLLTPAERTQFIATSPNSIEELFDRDPPRAIFVGFEGELDLPFIQYAEENNYIRVTKDFEGGTLYTCCAK